jgi:hypothetical protein
MEISGGIKKEFIITLEFKDSHEASVFQSMMASALGGKPMIEYKEEIKNMASDIYDKCIKLWKG